MVALFLMFALCTTSHAAPTALHFIPRTAEVPFQKAWTMFKANHDKAYATAEEEHHRLMIFGENLKKILSHNYLFDMGLKSYKMGINQFADMEQSEVMKMNGVKRNSKTNNNLGSSYLSPDAIVIPGAVDWRHQGYVTPVKNQFRCGSCWAFSSTGSLEGQHFRKTGKLVSLSEQNLIDCSSDEGNEGCDGGLMDYAFKYIKENGGVDSEESYPYEAMNGLCRFKKEYNSANVSGYVDIQPGNETLLTEAVATVGPVSVAVQALDSFMSYQEGIYEESSCDPTKLNHALLVVGYGSENGKDYYIVKNSWGLKWGESGYIRIARNKNNLCGIASMASYPLV